MKQQTTTGIMAQIPAFFRRRVGIASLAGGVLVVVIVLALMVSRAHMSLPPPNPAEVVAKQFYTAIQQQNYPAAWGMLASDQQAQLTQFAFIRFAQEQDHTYGAVTGFSELRYDGDRNHANQGVVQLHVTRASKLQYQIGLTITREADGTWKISQEDHAI